MGRGSSVDPTAVHSSMADPPLVSHNLQEKMGHCSALFSWGRCMVP